MVNDLLNQSNELIQLYNYLLNHYKTHYYQFIYYRLFISISEIFMISWDENMYKTKFNHYLLTYKNLIKIYQNNHKYP